MPKQREDAHTARWRALAEAEGRVWNEDPGIRGSWGPNSEPLFWTWDWGGLIVLGIARWEYQVRVEAGGEVRIVVRRAEWPDTASEELLLDAVVSRYGSFRSRGWVLVVDEQGLANFRPSDGADHQADVPVFRGDRTLGTRLRPPGAEWLWRERGALERSGVLSASAWCTACGSYFEDGRLAIGSATRIARWCSACRSRRTRHLPHYRRCAALDCRGLFHPARGNQLYCSNRCRSAASAAT
jgi:hypothetical protein